MSEQVGIGDLNAPLKVYIANRPPLPEFAALTAMQPLVPGELAAVVTQTGNHWRKIFNIYAKLAFALQPMAGCTSWQQYRDRYLLQQGAGQALLFSPPPQDLFSGKVGAVHIIAGRTYAALLFESLPGSLPELQWLDKDFAIGQQLIVCPYFDYRQLSNIKLERLVGLASPLLFR